MKTSFLKVVLLALSLAAIGGCASQPGVLPSPVSNVSQGSLGSFDAAVKKEAILNVLTAAADWQLANPSKHPRYDWTQAPFWISLTAFAPISRDPQKYLAAVRRNGEEILWRPGPRPLHADDHAIAQSYFLLHQAQPNRAMIAPALDTFKAVVLFPTDESLEFVDYAKTSRAWTWCDALYMSPPALAMATRATGDRRYLDYMNRYWWKVTDYLYDKEEHLFYRDSRFFNQRAPNGKKIFWSRGNGWVMGGLVRVLEDMPADYADRPRYVALLREMATKIASVQQSDGYWRTSLLDPTAQPLPETSGTAFYVYALAWGVNRGVLDRAAYEPGIRRGWSALVRAVHADGMLGHVQRIGDQPGDTTAQGTEIYGVGAFVLAGSEVYRLAQN
jgi:unsaturated rhamnogalacturonyl hydrolase